MQYRELLKGYSPSNLVDEDDPKFMGLVAGGGCRVCAEGDPCRDRIATDVEDILQEARLPATHRVRCLQWLIDRGESSLTHSIRGLAQAYSEMVGK